MLINLWVVIWEVIIRTKTDKLKGVERMRGGEPNKLAMI